MPSLGAKKKDHASRMERFIEDLPPLSNEMQLSIMNKVKTGELSIDDALDLARKDQFTKLQSDLDDEEELPSHYNFSVHKHGRYRWKKRVLQMDFTTKMLCTIEKGIVKRQLPFVIVKSCDDGVGSRFSISFKGHHDYELEATSVDDKHKIMQLVHQIIYRNIYSHAEGGRAGTHQQPQASQTLRKGVLLLHKGGLASFRWVKYEVQLHPGQLTLIPFSRQGAAEGDRVSATPLSVVIHLSDGDTSVQKPHSADTFTLVTRKNQYHFRVPPSSQPLPGAVQTERDAWVQAVSKLCSDWKRKSKSERMFVGGESLRHLGIAEDEGEDNNGSDDNGSDDNGSDDNGSDDNGSDDNGSDLESADEDVYEDPNVAHQTSQVPDVPTQTAPDPTPSHPGPPPSNLEPPNNVADSIGDKVPSTKTIPLPPPLPFRFKISPRQNRTKAFHWDIVGPDKIAKSVWRKGSRRTLQVDTTRLYMQFSVKKVQTLGAPEPSTAQHIMLNQKIAHNFNIFLKSFAVQPAELKDKLFVINEEDGGLSDEHIASLRRYVPTVEDVDMYKSYKGAVSELHIVDQYMKEMCDIPYLSTQLDLLLTMRELPISMRDLQPLIGQKIAMCTELHTCRSFVCVLEYLLAIGNYLNENAGKEKAKGFRLSSLANLSQLRGRERNFTLLHALVEQIMLQEPLLANFTNELAEFEAVPGASVKGLTAEVDVLKNELQKVIQYGKTSKKRNVGAHHAHFSKDLKVKFGEAADQDSQELFGFICQFIHDFKRARADVM
ncbi:uncharacterized protein LOC144058132 isoform X2 [Vanacampus margaritifer]